MITVKKLSNRQLEKLEDRIERKFDLGLLSCRSNNRIIIRLARERLRRLGLNADGLMLVEKKRKL